MIGTGKNLFQPVHARDLGNAYFDVIKSRNQVLASSTICQVVMKSNMRRSLDALLETFRKSVFNSFSNLVDEIRSLVVVFSS